MCTLNTIVYAMKLLASVDIPLSFHPGFSYLRGVYVGDLAVLEARVWDYAKKIGYLSDD